MKDILTLRSLRYGVTEKQVDTMKDDQKFRDLVWVGTLLNAITYAHEKGVPYELATLKRTRTTTRETIYITDGLLFAAFDLGQTLIDRYKDHPCVNEFDSMLRSFEDYNPPEVLLDMRANGPFVLAVVNRSRQVVNTYNVNGKRQLLNRLDENRKGIAIATVINSDEYYNDIKRGGASEAHQSIESVVDCIVDDFTLAAEEFIFSISKELGLKNAQPKPPKAELKLAA